MGAPFDCFSETVRPSASTVIDAQDLERVVNQTVRNEKRRPRNHEFACSGDPAGSTHFWVIGKQCFNILDDAKYGALRGCRIVLLDVGAQRHKIINCLRGPNRGHERLGIGRSLLLPQDVTRSLTCAWAIPSPRSRDAIACLRPATLLLVDLGVLI